MATITLSGRLFRRYPIGQPLGYDERDLFLGTADTAFVLVDAYGWGFDPGSDRALENENEYGQVPIEMKIKREIVQEHLSPALEAARKTGFPIVYVSNSAPRISLADSTYWEQKWNTLHLDKNEYYAEQGVDPLEYHSGTPGVLLYSNIVAPQPGDYYVRKHVHSGFFDTRLDTLLRNFGTRNLVFVGFALDECVGTTMIDALWRNYRVILLRDCTCASEIPTVDEPGSWTKRWILYTECSIGYTATSEAWVEACLRVS